MHVVSGEDVTVTYEPRTYRRTVQTGDLVSFQTSFRETDLHVSAESDLADRAQDLIVAARWEIESYIKDTPRFREALVPYEVPEGAPPLVRAMAAAAARARVGPMAAVAGAIAQYVAEGLHEHSSQVIVENGGDVYIIGDHERIVGIYAGGSPLSGRVGVRVPPGLQPVAVCTSSGTVGHSYSMGAADAVTVLARDGALADAVATGLANRVSSQDDIERSIDAARLIMGVLGVMVVVGDAMGAWGNVRLVSLED